MADSPLLSLPPELRNRIEELVLRRDTPVVTQWLNDTRPFHRLRREGDESNVQALALTTTCKNVRSECVNLFFAFNIFEFKGSSLDSHFRNRSILKILNAVSGLVNQQTLGGLPLDLGVLSEERFPDLTSKVKDLQGRIIGTPPDLPLTV